MTALINYRDTKRMGDDVHPTILNIPVADNVKIFRGGMVGLDSAGRAIPASTSATKVVGVAEFDADNTIVGHTAGGISARVRQGTYKFANGGTTDALTQADQGFPCYASDDQTVNRTSASGTRPVAGTVVQVDADGVWLQLSMDDRGVDGVDIHLVAAADLRTSQFFIVTVDGNGKAALCGNGATPVGVLQNTPNINELARVRVLGRSNVVTAATPAAGSLIASDAAGKAKAAVLSTTNTSDAGAASDALVGSSVLGMLLAVGVANTAVPALIFHQGALPTTAA